jgi:hypothetical protein
MTPQEFQRTQRKFERIFKGVAGDDNGDDKGNGDSDVPASSPVRHLADLLVEADDTRFPTRAHALRFLLGSKRGAALMTRMRSHIAAKRADTSKSSFRGSPEPSAADLRAAKADVVQKLGADAVAVAKAITASGNTYGLSRDEFVQIIEGYAARQHPTLRKDVAFAKVMEEPDVHQAYRMIKQRAWDNEARGDIARAKFAALPFEVSITPKETDKWSVDDALAALNELMRAQQKAAPYMSTAEAFRRIYENPDNAEAVQRYKQARLRALGA